MNETLFREKSLQKVKSPDNLGEYIRVANPAVWMLMTAILFLLLGLCCWGIFGSVRTVIHSDAHCEEGQIVCYLSEQDAARLQPGMAVTLNGGTGTISEVHVMAGSKSCCYVTTEQTLPEGIYDAEIEVESVRPLSFLLN